MPMNKEQFKNQIKEKFHEIYENFLETESLLNMFLTALYNEFEPPEMKDIQNYASVIKKHVEKYGIMLDELMKKLSLPEEQTKLTVLRTYNFEHKADDDK